MRNCIKPRISTDMMPVTTSTNSLPRNELAGLIHVAGAT